MENVYSQEYVLTAGESNAEGRMPLTLLAERIIEVATCHANALGIGYSTLIRAGAGWVLSRMSIEMKRYPGINERYSLTTWIESYNRRFSERNVAITGAGPEDVLGYARTVWVAMDFATRGAVDLERFGAGSFPTADQPCPIARAPRIAAFPVVDRQPYTFRYCDLDFNRHVNTVRYIELILNGWTLDFYDSHHLERFDILFHRECHYGEAVELCVSGADGDGRQLCSIVARDDDARPAVSAAVTWKEDA